MGSCQGLPMLCLFVLFCCWLMREDVCFSLDAMTRVVEFFIGSPLQFPSKMPLMAFKIYQNVLRMDYFNGSCGNFP